MITPNSPVEDLRGVGPKLTKMLNLAGFHVVYDLLTYYPRTYDDYTNATNIANLQPGKVTLKAAVESVGTLYVRGNMKITTATLVDSSGDRVKAVWFNQPYRKNQLAKGETFLFTGNFDFRNGRYQLTNPSCVRSGDLDLKSDNIVPVYSVKAGVPQRNIKNAIEAAKSAIPLLVDDLPTDIISEEDLMSLPEAIQQIHFPSSRQLLKKAKERLAYGEVLTIVLAAKLNKLANSHLKSYEIKFNQPAIKRVIEGLPFKLTDEQRRSAWEILLDIQHPSPMNRLLQGDVGSGKTVVAAIASYQTAIAGLQVSVMAPTEILATQHFYTMRKILHGHDVHIELITSSTKPDDRSRILESLANGEIDIIIGTHALLQDDVVFRSLGLVIIDEQHRFGVRQRQALLSKSGIGNMPHLLSMTATPIPRSLQLTLFGDLDISTIKQLPGGRKPITTKIVSPGSINNMMDQIDEQLHQGRQAYFVAKLIDDTGATNNQSISATELHTRISSRFPGHTVSLLHGKLSPAEKDEIMKSFKDGQIDILVSTTVVEVGVDVPNATIMVVYNADMFGLAQLHQLRGRVGRGIHASFCFLVQTDTQTPSRRLVEMEKTQDGFYLAEVDLQMRGAGEIYGTAQHGQLNLKMANLADTQLLARASQQAAKMANKINATPEYLSKYKLLRDNIDKYQKLTNLN